ncbi:F-box protein At1g47056-like [Olea europaea var. sylvestris]|uniref:F-box protein At1g47056-like n=1 Tax=Olea europaea var. sylvestris TaxID=158386 RepID=UPI000C1CEAB5|nr:F-box protein At1g47056-like [Olea europaea var. sylvestris]
MGQAPSTGQGYSPGNSMHLRNPSLSLHHHRYTVNDLNLINSQLPEDIFVNQQEDYISEIPDECLALIFQSLSSRDRKQCSLVSRRWFVVEGQSRHRLALNATTEVNVHLPSIFTRFDSITKLALRCDRKSVSINDEGLTLISMRCQNLIRLKLRGCREISDQGMSALGQNCKSLRKFSCGSCMFGVKGMNALLNNCSSLEELSVKRLRGINDGFVDEPIGPGAAASSLKSITLKELFSGQCFGPLIIGSKNLKTLKILKCLGDWDSLLETIAGRKNYLTEIHLERLQVSDIGLMAISKCPDLEIFHLVKAPDCSNEGICAVAENCKLLRKLHIDGWRTNRIGDEGLIAIAKNSVNLVELVLIGVNPSSVSLMAIATNCQKLERLALCGSETIGDPEISCIAAKCMALKKLCIKGCRVTDSGIEAFAYGCPNLVKIKVKKCRGVTSEVADLLRASRMSLAVNLDADEIEQEAMDVSASDEGAQDDGVEFPPIVSGTTIGGGGSVSAADAAAPSTSNGTRSSNKSRFSLFAGRTFVACAFRRLSNGNGNSKDSL